jgi:hypothetical protein
MFESGAVIDLPPTDLDKAVADYCACHVPE